MTDDAVRLHDEAIVFDMVSPLLPECFERAVGEYLAGGVTAVAATVNRPGDPDEDPAAGLRGMAYVLGLIRSAPDRTRLVLTVEDVDLAASERRLGVVLHFQNATQFGLEVSNVEAFYRLGLRAAQLTYNIRNFIGDGCTESSDAGLSRFGRLVVREMNRVGMVVDGSHTGFRTTLEAIEICEAPFIFSHSGCRAVYDHPRNITDEQIRACAATGGVVGILGLPYFISASRQPAIADIVRHAAHAADVVGTDHIGIGMDYWHGVSPYSPVADQIRRQAEPSILWNPGDRPPGPWSYAPGLETPAGMRNLTAALLGSGFSAEDVRKILGANFLRVFAAVWK